MSSVHRDAEHQDVPQAPSLRVTSPSNSPVMTEIKSHIFPVSDLWEDAETQNGAVYILFDTCRRSSCHVSCTVVAERPSTRMRQTGLQEPVSLGTNPTSYPASGKSCHGRGGSELFDLGSLSLRNTELTSQPGVPHSPDHPFCSLGGPPDLVKGPHSLDSGLRKETGS